jgi:hypothetical protein
MYQPPMDGSCGMIMNVQIAQIQGISWLAERTVSSSRRIPVNAASYTITKGVSMTQRRLKFTGSCKFQGETANGTEYEKMQKQII